MDGTKSNGGQETGPQCRFTDGEAVARFALDKGCFCYPDDREQDLCLHHIVKATPLGGMKLIVDYTLDGSFTRWWHELVEG